MVTSADGAQLPSPTYRTVQRLFGASPLFGACSAPAPFGANVRRRSAPFGARALFGACSALEPIYRRQEPNNTGRGLRGMPAMEGVPRGL